MRKTLLTVLAAVLFAAATSQIASAAERHHTHKAGRVAVSDPFRNANNSVAAPVQSGWAYGGYSAPAGH